MTTRIKTISLNMRKAYAKVQAAEEKCKSVEQAVNRTKIYCYAVTDKLNILTEESKKRTRYVWESQNKNTEFSLVEAMWQAGEEVEEAKRLLNEAIDKNVNAQNKLAIIEAEKKIILEKFNAECKSTAELLFNEYEQYIHDNYPEVDTNEIKLKLSNILSERTKHPELSKRDIIGCMCGKIPCNIRYSNYLTGMMPICKPCHDDCSICLEPLADKQCVKTSCNHIFHLKCMFKIENMHKFLTCPMCRNYIGILSQDSDRDKFLQLKQCNCCERHKQRRPRKFSSKAAFSYQCSNPLADILMEILRDYDNSIREPKCKCDCRKKMRLYCYILPDKSDELDASDDFE